MTIQKIRELIAQIEYQADRFSAESKRIKADPDRSDSWKNNELSKLKRETRAELSGLLSQLWGNQGNGGIAWQALNAAKAGYRAAFDKAQVVDQNVYGHGRLRAEALIAEARRATDPVRALAEAYALTDAHTKAAFQEYGAVLVPELWQLQDTFQRDRAERLNTPQVEAARADFEAVYHLLNLRAIRTCQDAVSAVFGPYDRGQIDTLVNQVRRDLSRAFDGLPVPPVERPAEPLKLSGSIAGEFDNRVDNPVDNPVDRG